MPATAIRSTRRLIAIVVAVATTMAARAAERLPRSTPEAQGVSSAALLDWVEAADAQIDTLNSFMLVRHGHVIAEGWWGPYQPEDPHILYSLTKSFTSTAVGLAASEGKLSLDDPVISFFPDEAPADPSSNLKNMRVRDLLIMSSGQRADVITGFRMSSDESLPRWFLSLPVDYKPGSFFIYNSPGTNMQAAIVKRATGEAVIDYLRPRLFEPLGIDHPIWFQNAHGYTDGAGGLSIRTEDIACFGQLFLQKGQWQGRQLVPAAWVEAATAKQTSNGSNPNSDWDQGYGYQFWRCRPGFARADGAFGQFCFIMPEQDAVLALTAGVRNTQGEMNVVYDKILPALGNAKLEANAVDLQKLKQRIAQLTIRGPNDAAPTSPLAAKFVGRTYSFPTNERHLGSVSLQEVNGETALVIRGDGYDGQPIVIGNGTWKRNATPTKLGTDIDPRDRVLTARKVAAMGGWTKPDTFVAKLVYFETPYQLSVELQFGGDLVVFNADYNLAFSNNAFPELIGRAPPP